MGVPGEEDRGALWWADPRARGACAWAGARVWGEPVCAGGRRAGFVYAGHNGIGWNCAMGWPPSSEFRTNPGINSHTDLIWHAVCAPTFLLVTLTGALFVPNLEHAHSIVHEIRRYRTNQLNRHIDAAVMYLDKTATTLFRAAHVEMAESLYADEYWRTESVRAARTSLGSMFVGNVPKWFRLRPETETILQGCQEIIPKLRDRLKDRKDLGAVEAALFDLTAYQYTEIPELSDTQSETRFEAGTESLIRFAQSVIALPPYRSEPMAATPEEKMSRRLLLATQKLSLPFTDSNVLIAFCAWLILMSILFWGGFYIASRFVAIKMDSTIMATLIGGPIATAVTGATIPRLGKTKKQEK